jgi:hypothetical protein
VYAHTHTSKNLQWPWHKSTPNAGGDGKGHAASHHTNAPAVIEPGIRQEWWYMSVKHRSDGPAVIEPSIREEWGFRHRVGIKPAVYDEAASGECQVWKHGKRILV